MLQLLLQSLYSMSLHWRQALNKASVKFEMLQKTFILSMVMAADMATVYRYQSNIAAAVLKRLTWQYQLLHQFC